MMRKRDMAIASDEKEHRVSVEAEAERRCAELVTHAWKAIADSPLANGKKLGKHPSVVFRDLGEKLHGMAYPDHIELNVSRLESPDREKFLGQTTRHEIAHVAEYRIAGVMTHGPLWHALDELIEGAGMQFTNYRPKEKFWEETLVSLTAVSILTLIVLVGAALIVRFPVWWGYLIGGILCGGGGIGLGAGCCELVNFFAKKA